MTGGGDLSFWEFDRKRERATQQRRCEVFLLRRSCRRWHHPGGIAWPVECGPFAAADAAFWEEAADCPWILYRESSALPESGWVLSQSHHRRHCVGTLAL